MISLATGQAILPPPRALPDNGQRRYWRWLDRQSEDQRHTLSEIKRLLERYRADDRFRAHFREAGADLVDLAARHGIHLDPRDAWPLLQRLDPDLPDDGRSGKTPLVDIWEACVAEMRHCLDDFLAAGDCA